MANKIFTLSVVKNEVDIIESAVRHAFNFADEVWICDLNSTDGTREILKLLQDENSKLRVFNYEKFGFPKDWLVDFFAKKAFLNGAEVFIPFDADEFIIMPGGHNSQELRTFLQNLDVNQVYMIDWIQCMFVEPEKDQDKFTLSRKTLRSRGVSKAEPAKKLVIGGKAFQKYNFSITPHNVELPDGNVFPQQRFLPDILNMHFRYRSASQWLSKDLALWLTRIVSDTRYTDAAPHSQQNVRDFLAGKKLSPDDIQQIKVVEDPIPADDDLAPYKDECSLKHTLRGGG